MEEQNYIYPYEVDEEYHKWSYCLFNVPGVPRLQLETCSVIMKHLEDLGFVGPNVSHPSKLIYDALGTSGGPWENGTWQGVDKPRASVTLTVPEKDVSDYDDADIAEMERVLNTLKSVKRAESAVIPSVDVPGEEGVD